MNRVIDSRVIFFLNEEREDPYFYNKEIEEHIKDLKLIFEPYFEHLEYLQRERQEQNSEENED